MNRLAQQLKEVVDARFNGSMRRAAEVAGCHPNQVRDILLGRPHYQPRLDTLAKLCDALGWDLCEAVYWSLGREHPTAEAVDPLVAFRRSIMRLGIPPRRQALLIGQVEEYLADQTSNSSSTTPHSEDTPTH